MSKPHRAVIWVEAEIHELRNQNECSGSPVFEIKKFPVYVDGTDKNAAIRRLNEVLEEFKNRCKQMRI